VYVRACSNFIHEAQEEAESAPITIDPNHIPSTEEELEKHDLLKIVLKEEVYKAKQRLSMTMREEQRHGYYALEGRKLVDANKKKMEERNRSRKEAILQKIRDDRSALRRQQSEEESTQQQKEGQTHSEHI
jgi:hypothetical protein